MQENGKAKTYPVDHVIICAGQESNQALKVPLEEKGLTVHVIGGARKALELDAKAAIAEAINLAIKI